MEVWEVYECRMELLSAGLLGDRTSTAPLHPLGTVCNLRVGRRRRRRRLRRRMRRRRRRRWRRIEVEAEGDDDEEEEDEEEEERQRVVILVSRKV